jgi:hypothetical protein
MAVQFPCRDCGRLFPTVGGRAAHEKAAHTHVTPGLELGFERFDQDNGNDNPLIFRMRLAQTDDTRFVLRTSPSTVASIACVIHTLKEPTALGAFYALTSGGVGFDLKKYPLYGDWWPELASIDGMMLMKCDVCGKDLRYHPEHVSKLAQMAFFPPPEEP